MIRALPRPELLGSGAIMRLESRRLVPLRIGDLARAVGTTTRAVRFYHESGLLPEPPRDGSGYRRYGPADVVRLVHICRLRALGMPVEKVAEVLEASNASPDALPDALQTLAADVMAEIDRLFDIHTELVTLVRTDGLDDAPEVLEASMRAEGFVADGQPMPAAERKAAQLVGAFHPGGLSGAMGLSGADADLPTLERFKLLARFAAVQPHEVDALAEELAHLIPDDGPRRRPEKFLPDAGIFLGQALNPAQRDCLERLHALLDAEICA